MPAGGSADDKARELREKARQLEQEAANWEQGAEGERRVAAVLDELPADFVVFHDLQLPAPSNANVDHLVIGIGGVWAIDAKHYTNKVTRGTGAGSDTLWTARKPLRDTLRTTGWEATKVGDLIGVAVRPMMCVIAPSIPEPAFDFDGVRVCEPRSMEAQLLGSASEPVDVVRVSNSVQRVFGVEPDPRTHRTARLVGSEARAVPSVSASRRRTRRQSEPATIRVGAPRPNWLKLLTSPLVRLAGLGVLAFAALAVLPTVAGWGGERLSDAVTESLLDVSPTTVARPPSSMPTVTSVTTAPPATSPRAFDSPPAVRYVTTCPTPGAGWVVSWVWPGELQEGALGYRIRTQDGDEPVWIRPATGAWDETSDPPRALQIYSTEFTIFTDLVGPDGNTAATTEQQFVAPMGTC